MRRPVALPSSTGRACPSCSAVGQWRATLLLCGAGLLGAAPAFACLPNPTEEFRITLCTGVSSKGIAYGTRFSSVEVGPGALLKVSGGPAISVSLFGNPVFRRATVRVAGTVDGGLGPGVRSQFGVEHSLILTVTGVVTGDVAYLLDRVPWYVDAQKLSVLIDNGGRLEGRSGIALRSEIVPSQATYGRVLNHPTGYIGAILAPVDRLENDGVIDGGSQSAYRTVSIRGESFASTLLRNGGVMRSASDAPTLSLPVSPTQLMNSGRIANDGHGPAIFIPDDVVLTNEAGGVVESRGPIAIGSDGDILIDNAGAIRAPSFALWAGRRIDLTSSGPIEGSVVAARGASRIELATGGSISGFVTLAEGDDLVASDAAIGGLVQLGAGDDRLELGPGGQLAAGADGGPGFDRAQLAGAGMALGSISGFEVVDMGGGDAGVSGIFRTGQLTIAGGQLVGAPGSLVEAKRIVVGPAARFASSGTVRGDLDVAGVLAPGASPGTMQVTGDVSLSTGARLELELTDAGQDRLLVEGAISVAPGVSLRVGGDARLQPGTVLDLVVARDGIAGGFDSVATDAQLPGLLHFGPDRISYLALFGADRAMPAQPAGAVDYVNDLIAQGRASPALLAAVPGLVGPDGLADQQAFARLTPEPHAAALALGSWSSLLLTQAAHERRRTRPESGRFTFVDVLGGSGSLAGERTVASSRAGLEGGGLVGGLGVAGDTVTVTAFVGGLEGRQRVQALASRTEFNGPVLGATVGVRHEGLWGELTLAAQRGHAETRRALPDGRTAQLGGRLDSEVADLRLGYDSALPGGGLLLLHAGLTALRQRHGGGVEAGSEAFDLSLQPIRHESLLGEVGIGVAADAARPVRPWVRAAVRQRLAGDEVVARATLGGGPVALTGIASPEDRTAATLAAGLAATVRAGLVLTLRYAGTFGSRSREDALGVGMVLRFGGASAALATGR